MYTVHFGCRERPFDITVDPRFLYVNSACEEAYAAILYGIQDRRGCIVLIGEAGTGKTSLVHRVLDALEEPTRAVVFDKTTLTFEELLDFICRDFGLRTPTGRLLEKIQALNAFLLEQQHAGGTGVLIVDEAQNLTDEVLENLRLLSNFEAANEKLLQLVLVGQPEFEKKLRQAAFRQLKQRIVVRCQLDRLPPQEIGPFILHRLRIAGCERHDIFTPDAIERIAVYSTGIPRLINVICDNAMLIAYGARSSVISKAIVEEVAHDLRLGGETDTPANLVEGSTDGGKEVKIIQRSDVAVSSAGAGNEPLFFTQQFSRPWLQPAVWAVGIVLIVGLLLHFEIFPTALRQTAARVTDQNPSAPALGVARPSKEVTQPREESASSPPASRIIPLPPTQKSNAPQQANVPQERGTIPPNALSSFSPVANATGNEWKGETITIARGDTISRIAMKMYGGNNALAFDLLKELNPHIEDLNRIVIGDKILFPALTRETLLRRQTDGSYQLIAGSFHSEEEAEKVAKTARGEGFTAAVTQQKVFGSHLLYRVSLEGLKDPAVIEQAWLQVAQRGL